MPIREMGALSTELPDTRSDVEEISKPNPEALDGFTAASQAMAEQVRGVCTKADYDHSYDDPDG